MDNIKFHHSLDTRNAAATKGFHQIFVPPYSPRGNTIEHVFGVLKAEYRSHCPPNVDLRSVDEFRSSVTCSKCWTRLQNMRACTTKWSWRNRRMETQLRARVHKVLHCSNSVKAGESPCCGTTWNRDVNASRNIVARKCRSRGEIRNFESCYPRCFRWPL